MRNLLIFSLMTITSSNFAFANQMFLKENKVGIPEFAEAKEISPNSFEKSNSREYELSNELTRANFWISFIDANKDLSPLTQVNATGTIDNDSFSNYLTDRCTVYDKTILNEADLRERGLRRCSDNTISYVQPPSKGSSGYEGRCGQTAASNIMYSYCKLVVSPENYSNAYLRDLTPGVRPGTLIRGLDQMFSENKFECPDSREWNTYSYRVENDFIGGIERGLVTDIKSKYKLKRKTSKASSVERTPVALLIRVPGGTDLHWITIVDLMKSSTKCEMVVNHWNKQYTVPCSKIAKWSRGVEDSYGIILDKYYVVKYL